MKEKKHSELPDKVENIINIEYSDIKGYRNNKNAELTEDTKYQNFNIIKLNKSELVLSSLNNSNKQLYFLKSLNSNDKQQ